MLDKTIRTFTEESASKAPVPGGGGVSALCGALAASLAEMVTNLTTGKKKYAEYEKEIQGIMKRTETLRISLLECIEKDAEAFAPLAAAYSMDKNTEGYEQRMETCLRSAAEPPYEIMKYCAEVIRLDERLAVIGSKLSVSDAGTSVMLAHGALCGAYLNVRVNTRLMKDREYAEVLDEKADVLLGEYTERALNCFNAVMERMDG